MIRKELKRGQTITYTRKVMFKDTETVKAKIVAIGRTSFLLDNGDELTIY